MEERENILRIFQETKEAVLKGDSVKIKSLSDQTTNTASLTHDPDNILIAVVLYSLSKIIERGDYKQLSGWNKFYNSYIGFIDKTIEDLKEKNDDAFREKIKNIIKLIDTLSGKLKVNIQEVFRKAKINKASRIYEHGISMEKTAKLLGVTLFELASYSGEKKTTEIPESTTINVKSRIKLIEEMFS